MGDVEIVVLGLMAGFVVLLLSGGVAGEEAVGFKYLVPVKWVVKGGTLIGKFVNLSDRELVISSRECGVWPERVKSGGIVWVLCKVGPGVQGDSGVKEVALEIKDPVLGDEVLERGSFFFRFH